MHSLRRSSRQSVTTIDSRIYDIDDLEENSESIIDDQPVIS